MISLIAALMTLYGCSNNPADSTETTLTENEEQLIVAAELSQNSGGTMAEIEMAAEVTSEAALSLAKSAGLDTAITNGWITYTLSLSFFAADGQEQNIYIDGQTDRIVWAGALAGSYAPETGRQEINLNKNSDLEITGITTGLMKINGTSTNNSSYKFTGPRTNLDVQVESSILIQDVVIDKNSSAKLPLSGRLEASLKGTFTKEGVLQQKDVKYNINFTVEFKGGSEVTVTLPSGNQFTVNLVSGEVS